jgi:hypothetical protein
MLVDELLACCNVIMKLMKLFGEQVSAWIDGKTEALAGALSATVVDHPEYGKQVCFFFGKNAKGNDITGYARPENADALNDGDEYPVAGVTIVERVNTDTGKAANTPRCRVAK